MTVSPTLPMRRNAIIRFPAVLADGNAAETDDTSVAEAEFDCKNAILPAPPPAATTLMLSAFVALWEAVSVTRIVKLLVPVPVGVPEMVPVAGPSVSPSGSVPEATVQAYGAVPPAAVSVALYAALLVPTGSTLVTIEGVAGACTTAVAPELAEFDPAELVALTEERMVDPMSAAAKA